MSRSGRVVVVCKIGGGETGRIGQCGEMNWDDADGGTTTLDGALKDCALLG